MIRVSRKHLLGVFLLLLSVEWSLGQHLAIDSLENELQRHPFGDTARINILNKLSARYITVDFNKAELYANEARALAIDRKYLLGEYRSIVNLQQIIRLKGDWVGSFKLRKEVLQLAQELNVPKFIADAYVDLGASYYALSYEARSFESYTKGLAIYKEIRDLDGQYSALTGLGAVYSNSDPELSKKYFADALTIASDKAKQQLAHLNLAVALHNQKRYNESLHQLEIALKIAEEIHSISLWYILYVFGEHYYFTGQPDRALAFYKRALQLAQESGNRDAQGVALLGLSQASGAKKDYTRMRAFIDQAFSVTKGLKKNKFQKRIYEQLVLCLEKSGDYAGAFKAQERLTMISDSINLTAERDRLALLKGAFETAQEDLKIESLKKQNEITRYTLTLIIFFILLVAVFFALIFTRARSLSRQRFNIDEAERITLEVELQKRKAQEEALNRELEFRNRELTSYTLNLLQRNEMLDDLRKSIEQLRLESEGEEANKKLANLITKVSLSPEQQDRDWDHFQKYFQKVHEGFFDNLKATYPELNPTELRLCALIKLNLETSQIASVMDLTPEGTKVARHRLRKKLKISGDVNLETFFNTRE